METKNIRKQVERIETSSDNNLQQFKVTKQRLETSNEELQTVIEDIMTEVEALNMQKEKAIVRMTSNESTIKGLDKLLNGES